MNLTALLAARAAAGRPVRVGLIGAGKFGSMFLSQVPTIAGAGGGRHRRPRPGPGARGLPHRRLGRGADRADALRRRRRASACADGDVEVVIEATGNPGRRHRACARRDRGRQAHRHGQCRGRRAGRAAAGGRGARRRASSTRWPTATSRRWSPRWSTGRAPPASRRRGRQGHQVPARLSRRDAGRRLGPLRADAGARRRRPA